ncbi:MAG: WD40 repeat domain-containing protein [Gemmataceae bacterium]
MQRVSVALLFVLLSPVVVCADVIPQPPSPAVISLEPKTGIGAFAFSGDGKYLAGSSGATALVWDTTTWKVVRKIKHETVDFLNSVAISPDGKYLATGPYRRSPRASGVEDYVRLWDMKTGKLTKKISVLVHPNRAFRAGVPSISFSKKGDKVAFIERMTVRVYSVPKLSLDGRSGYIRSGWVDYNEQYLCGADISPDGNWIAVGSRTGRLRVWDIRKKRSKALLLYDKPGQAEVWSVAFTPDSKKVVFANFFSIFVADIETKKITPLGRHSTNDVRTVVISPDGKYVASAGGEGVRLWRLSDRKMLRHFRSKSDEFAVAFSPDGRWLALEISGQPQVWNVPKLVSK